MKKQANINIIGTQIVDGVADNVELNISGTFYSKNGSYYISYDESDESGYKNCKTTLKITGEDKAVMMRSGGYKSHLVIEPSRRNVCEYQTLYGAMMLGISSAQIKNALSENGGEATIKYSLDVDAILLSENELKIQVQ